MSLEGKENQNSATNLTSCLYQKDSASLLLALLSTTQSSESKDTLQAHLALSQDQN